MVSVFFLDGIWSQHAKALPCFSNGRGTSKFNNNNNNNNLLRCLQCTVTKRFLVRSRRTGQMPLENAVYRGTQRCSTLPRYECMATWSLQVGCICVDKHCISDKWMAVSSHSSWDVAVSHHTESLKQKAYPCSSPPPPHSSHHSFCLCTLLFLSLYIR